MIGRRRERRLQSLAECDYAVAVFGGRVQGKENVRGLEAVIECQYSATRGRFSIVIVGQRLVIRGLNRSIIVISSAYVQGKYRPSKPG